MDKFCRLIIIVAYSFSFAGVLTIYPDAVAVAAPAHPETFVPSTPLPTLTQISTPVVSGSILTPLNNDCPPGGVIGDGVTTPSADWLAACGHCLNTPTVAPATVTPAPTNTAVATVTPGGGTVTPTLTLTVTPTATPFGCGDDMFLYGSLSDVTTPSGLNHPSDGSDFSCDQTSESTIFCSGTVAADNPQEPGENYNAVSYFVLTFVTTPGTTVWIDLLTAGTGLVDPGFGHCGVYAGCTFSLNYHGTWTTGNDGPGNTHSLYLYHTVPPDTGRSMAFELAVSLGESCLDDRLPGPTPTPSAGSMCSIITDEDDLSTSPWVLGGGAIILQYCFTTPSISYLEFFMAATAPIDLFADLTWLYAIVPDGGLNPFMICYRGRDYSLYLFGMRIPVAEFVALGILMSAFGIFTGSMSGIASIGRYGSRSNGGE